jgi:magnesium transporter
MLATNTKTTGMELILPTTVRYHDMPAAADAAQLRFAPALSFHQQVTAQQALDALRQMQDDIESIYYLFVTDSQDRLVGVVSLHKLICVAPGARLFEFMDRRIISLPHDATLKQQARIMSESGLLALPVVDEQGRLVGALDAGDLSRAMQEESTAEMYHLAGLAQDESIEQSARFTFGYRSFWLVANLLTAFVVAFVLSGFEGLLTTAPVLVALLPLSVLQGGQAARQTLTFVERSLALGQVSLSQSREVLGRELTTGALNGLLIGALAGALVWLWQGQAALGLLAGGAIFANTLLAALAGAGVPLAFRKQGIDPARASAVLVATVTNMGGVLLLLGMGALALQWGYL